MPPSSTADGPIAVDMRPQSAHRARISDHGIAELAVSQHGVVSVEQLRKLGMAERAIRRRVAIGRLHRVHRGVYAVGYLPLTMETRWMAAVLAGGEDAVLSHRSAAALWGLRKDDDGPLDVTAPNRRGRAPKGISAHRDDHVAPTDRTMWRGIPCMTVERTLLDIAAVLPEWELRKAIAQAEVLGILDFSAMRELIRRSRGRRGVARLRLIFEELDPATKRTRSELERRFLRLCRNSGLPRPEVNVALDIGDGRIEVDFLWRDAGLVVEVDGRQFHDTASAFQRDRWREQRLQLAGWRVSRWTWQHVENEPGRVTKTIRALLGQQNPRRRA